MFASAPFASNTTVDAIPAPGGTTASPSIAIAIPTVTNSSISFRAAAFASAVSFPIDSANPVTPSAIPSSPTTLIPTADITTVSGETTSSSASA
eukprot:6208152-Pleurochrysis_carterae.AAC.1